MRVVLIISALLLVAASGAILVPDAEPIRPCLSETALALAILVLIGVFSQSRQTAPRPKPEVEPVRPLPPQPEASRADAEIVHFPAMLPERGRLIDFLMDDINPYSDAQVGAAARSSTPDAMPFCKDIVASNRYGQSRKDRRCKLQLGIQPTSTSRACLRCRARDLLHRASPMVEEILMLMPDPYDCITRSSCFKLSNVPSTFVSNIPA